MFYLITTLLSIIIFFIYIRYFPVTRVKCVSILNRKHASIEIVDVRDFNQSYKDPITEAINIPFAYLKRNYHEISNSEIHIVASNHLEKNMSIRFLRKRGFDVIGYTLTDCKCKNEINYKTA